MGSSRASADYQRRQYDAGLCIRCGGEREDQRQHCGRCRAARRAQAIEKMRRAGKMPRERVVRTLNFNTDDLILAHLHYVMNIAGRKKRDASRHIEFTDLVSAGVLALVQAARYFDPNRGVPFGAWIVRPLRWAIAKEVRALTHHNIDGHFMQLDERVVDALPRNWAAMWSNAGAPETLSAPTTSREREP